MAGLILDNFVRGRRRAVWISASADLVRDAHRDLLDIDCHCRLVRSQRELDKHGTNWNSHNPTVLFTTYSMIIQKKRAKGRESRLQQLIKWCAGNDPESFDGLVIFDECHRAKGEYSWSNSHWVAFVSCNCISTAQKCPDQIYRC